MIRYMQVCTARFTSKPAYLSSYRKREPLVCRQQITALPAAKELLEPVRHLGKALCGSAGEAASCNHGRFGNGVDEQLSRVMLV